LRAMHLNTVLAPVQWELLEPSEGKFDFTQIDTLIRDARANDLRLVILWFGAWKNSMSTYTPAWVKRDSARFPLAQMPNGPEGGRGVEILSAMAPATLDADKRAYTKLLDHIRAVDDQQNTVVMVQVENEIGMLPVVRDYGPLAQAAYAGPVPTALTTYLERNRAALVPALKKLWEDNGAKISGTWAQVFGAGIAGEEVFTAWHYARFAGDLAYAGQQAYRLPAYVNVALNRPARLPGEYPSGGPLPHLIESIDDKPGALAAAYGVLEQISPQILAAQGTGRMSGFRPKSLYDETLIYEPQVEAIGDVRFTVAFADIQRPVASPKTGQAAGIIIQTGKDEYLIAGQGITVTMTPLKASEGSIGIESAWEGQFDKAGRWIAGRLLNGDQTHQGRHIRLGDGEWQIQRVRLYHYR
jgi:beta-galactosidase GanA